MIAATGTIVPTSIRDRVKQARQKGYEGDPCSGVRLADDGPQRRLHEVRHLRGDERV